MINTKEKELVLFSGGPDSAVLLKYFLEQKKNIHVLYNENNYHLGRINNHVIQTKVVAECLNFFRKKYGHFEYTHTGIFLGVPNDPDLRYGSDDQWNVFLASIICRQYGIKKIWCGSFTYNDFKRDVFNMQEPFWLTQAYMQPHIDGAIINSDERKRLNIQYLTPKNFYKGTEIDKLKNKKEAWDYLDKELQQIVRSCISEEEGVVFCGKCNKCTRLIYFKIKDKNGNNL
jgi:hypothetical protein